jgi:uncharacterized protein
MKPKFKILSIDGGGIRGIIPCAILAFIENNIGGNLCDTFNLIAGTSTGGIIALGLATNKPNEDYPYYAKEMLDLYKNNGKQIFPKREQDFTSRLGSLFEISEKISAKPYNRANLEKILKDYFGDERLSNTQTDTLITTYDITKGKPFYFSSRLAKSHDNENNKEDFEIWEVAASTSAAPTFFTPSIIKDREGEDFVFVDGGVFANNPSILAFSEAKELWKAKNKKTFSPVVTPDNDESPFYLLSLGTGVNRYKISSEDANNWRTLQWIEPLLSNVFMQSVAESTHYTMQHLLPPYENGMPRYQRFNVPIPKENSDMDNVSDNNIDQLSVLAEKYIKENRATLLRVCEILQ